MGLASYSISLLWFEHATFWSGVRCAMVAPTGPVMELERERWWSCWLSGRMTFNPILCGGLNHKQTFDSYMIQMHNLWIWGTDTLSACEPNVVPLKLFGMFCTNSFQCVRPKAVYSRMCFAWRSSIPVRNPPLTGTPTLDLQPLKDEAHTEETALHLLVVASNWSGIRLGNCTFLSCWVCLDCETKEDYSASSRRPHLEGSLAVENKKKGGGKILHLLLQSCRFAIYMTNISTWIGWLWQIWVTCWRTCWRCVFWISKRASYSCYLFWSSADINISVRRSWKSKNDCSLPFLLFLILNFLLLQELMSWATKCSGSRQSLGWSTRSWWSGETGTLTDISLSS